MNIKDTNKAIKVMQAWVDGEKIIIDGAIPLVVDPKWDWFNTDYSIKPQPLGIWCIVNSKGRCLSNQPSEDDCIESIADLNRQHNNEFEDYKPVLFRQVMDE